MMVQKMSERERERNYLIISSLMYTSEIVYMYVFVYVYACQNRKLFWQYDCLVIPGITA